MAGPVELDKASLVAVMDQVQKALTKTQPIMAAIGRTLERNAKKRFDTKTAPSGKPWKPWAASTAKARAREGRGTLLDYTGQMRDSLTYLATSTSVQVGFGVAYAVYHEFGTNRIPARPALYDNGGLGDKDATDVLASVMQALALQLPT